MKFDKYDVDGAYHWAECDRRLANWKRYNPALDARYAVTVRAIAAVSPRDILLDVGCGDGMLLSRAAPLVLRAVGVDTEPTAVALARDKLRVCANCVPLRIGAAELPLRDGSIDVAVSADVIEHLEEPQHHLREIARVLKPGGTLVLTTPKWRRSGKWDPRHVREYQAHELAGALEEYFGQVSLTFFWPTLWSRVYDTRVGWRLLKLAAIAGVNPFGKTASNAEGFGQILAVCRAPKTPNAAPRWRR